LLEFGEFPPSNVKIVSERRLDAFPADWIEWAKKNDGGGVFEATKRLIEGRDDLSSVPESLREFSRRRRALLGLAREAIETADYCASHGILPASLTVKMDPKKEHEVRGMAAAVADNCKAMGIGRVVDVGSGMGYLGLVLSAAHGLNVVCLESDEGICDRAGRRCGRAKEGTIETVNVRVGDDSIEQLADIIGEKGEAGVALVGLHCCGDLSVDVLKLFAALGDRVRLLALVSCCFHKIKKESSVPLSREVRSVLAERGTTDVVRSSFLHRLAAQQAYSHWAAQSVAEHEAHMRAFGFRAVLEDFVRKEDLRLKKKRRRGRKKDSPPQNDRVEGFAVWMRDNFDIVDPFDEQKLADHVTENLHVLPLLEFVTGLQQSMQELALDLMVLDRLAFLREQPGVQSAGLFDLFDPDVSSMNKLLIAKRS
jgi:hypothetical protein